MSALGRAALAAALVAAASPEPAGSLAPPVSAWRAFDAGAGGFVEAGPGARLFRPEGGAASLGVRGRGSGSVFWRSPDLELEPGGTYVFRFRARGSGSGLIVSGPPSVNHDFRPPPDWESLAFAFRLPDGDRGGFLRLGHWELDGEVLFRDPELVPARVVHRAFEGGLVLGAGERLEAGTYVDAHALGWEGTTIHRTLFRQRAQFNTHRWVFGPGSEVVYRHELPCEFREGSVLLNVNYRAGGALAVSASRDGETWIRAAESARLGEVAAPLPASLFPCRTVFVKLEGLGEGTNLQVDAYRFEASVAWSGPRREGKTWVVEERVLDPEVEIAPRVDGGAVVSPRPGISRERRLEVTLELDGRTVGAEAATVGPPAGGPAGETRVALPEAPVLPGGHTLCFRAAEAGRVVYLGVVAFTAGPLEERGYGSSLAGDDPSLRLWWCEGARKVARDCPPPASREGDGRGAVRVEAARGEYEPAQLVLRALEPGVVLEEVSVEDLRGPGSAIPAREVRVFEVATVRVEHPTDSAGGPGDYPDPLPPLDLPLALRAGENQALWILARVPEGIPAGEYRGALRLRTNRGRSAVPLEVRVFDFELPPATRLRGGFGLDPGLIRRYHRLRTDEELRAVYDLYLLSFLEHRVMPYSFFALDPIRLSWQGEGPARRPAVEFSAFDRAAERYLGGAGTPGGRRFNSFLLPVEGLGGGTFHSRHPGAFGGHSAGTPEYEALLSQYLGQLEGHLRERGWLDAAYVYWFDEPEPKDYPFVVDVMARLKRHAPGLRRMLTEQPEKDLIGHVEIWCGLTPEWTPERVAERRAAGEEVWWYLCTGPRAPYVGIFVEHPALEMRLWPWQSWQYGVQGILVWQTNYWTSSAAFPDSLQDPWRDPMSYVSGYDTPAGAKRFWGNGDGRFLYPPRRDPNAPGDPVVAPPISSIRWENLRDGIEDYEYLALLEELCRKRGPDDAAAREARNLLSVPEEISRDLTHFTKDPRVVLDRRRKIAEAIERLRRP